jgi:2-polyprenyl-6-methoxyphenol hydroxylase-like FAD-dependent oxidoreductase
MREIHDVIIAGAGPTGLMLAAELCLAGVRPLVLEREPQLRDDAQAGGVAGQITQLLEYRGLLERIEAATGRGVFALPLCPFGDLHLDFSQLADPPVRGLQLPQEQLERVLNARAGELGADIRRGAEITGVVQDDEAVTALVRAADGPHRVSARYLVGCDGGRSKVRAAAGFAFPGTTYPDVNRLARLTLPASVTRMDNGDLDVPGAGIVRAGFTRTERGTFALGSVNPEIMGVQTTEPANADFDDDAPLTLTELGASIRRVLGVDIPLGTPLRLTRYRFHARQIEHYRNGRIFLAGDAAHLFPSTGTSINAGMSDAVNLAWKLAAELHGWAPAGLLDSYHHERRFAGERAMLHNQAQMALRRRDDPAVEALRDLFRELVVDEQPLRRIGALFAGTDLRYPPAGANQHRLTGTFVPSDIAALAGGSMRNARPVFVDLAGRADLREIAGDRQHRIDRQTGTIAERPADAVLIRPDATVAWAAAVGEPAATAATTLREALSTWFGEPASG